MQERWRAPYFVTATHAWIDDRLADLGRRRAGEVVQPHVTDWSTLLRVETDGGTVWFKANEESMVPGPRRSSRHPPLPPSLEMQRLLSSREVCG